MNAERLIQHFDRIAEPPGAVPRLRRFVLDLAVRGWLGLGDSVDPSARLLLHQIAEERADLIARRMIRREKPPAPVREDEVPYEIPERWCWSRLGDVVLFTQYGTSQKAQDGGDGVGVLAMGNIQNGSVSLQTRKSIPRTSAELPDLLLDQFDILYNRTNSAELVGKTGIYLGEGGTRTFASYLIRLRPSLRWTNPRFLNAVMNAPVFRETQVVPLIKKQTGQANVNGSALRNMLIPLPPVAEQTRIVAMLDEIMTLCDRLEGQLAHCERVSSRFLEAVLRETLADENTTRSGPSSLTISDAVASKDSR